MSKIRHLVIPILMIALITTVAAPALAQSGNNTSLADGNFICESAGLSSLLSSVMVIIVTLAALVGIAGGAGFSLAAASKPGDSSDYLEKRNNAVKYGLGTVVVLYVANAIGAAINPGLDFGCILPGV